MTTAVIIKIEYIVGQTQVFIAKIINWTLCDVIIYKLITKNFINDVLAAEINK